MSTVCFPVCPADSIEANVENADVNVQRATQQLSRAADYQVKRNGTERMINGGRKGKYTKTGIRKGQCRGEAFNCPNIREVRL